MFDGSVLAITPIFLFMTRRKNRSKNKKRSFLKQLPNPSPNIQTYHGPIVSKAEKEEVDSITLPLNFTGVITSSAGGVIDASYSTDPSSYALADWTNIAGTWHEYRVLGMRMEFFPNNRYSKTSTVCTPMIVVIDRASAGLLGSYQAAMDHSSAKKVSLEDPWVKEYRMSNVAESAFIPVGSPVAHAWIKFYADSLSVSTQYGRAFVYLLLQVRGRK